MKKKTMIIAGAAAAVIVLAGGGIAVASTLDDRVSASDRESVSQAALAEVGSGVVTDVDRLDDGLEGYEVDVTRDDGREVSVLLDGEGAVVSSRVDDRGDSDDDGSTGSTGSTGSVDADDRDGDDVATGSASGAPTTGDRDDAELTGADYDRASAAAIEAAGGGVVTDADRSDDRDVAYEVDVRLDDGTEVDVDLDADFGVVRTDVDSPRR
ncbi:hypothetical protein SOM11_10295 [Frigoribacterium sp. CFBP9039]|uniref:PepSY domain-containing protein n=1 Tax=Frigoribacterium sp. CFBP9029 TaxID=3096541 RepID=UPI002A6B22C9|nr:PepSY domain-containing protein [Frigoribacterium sp. CFBP9039]MDY0946370.1 hypothetical protein [Frigoribacterium sp. CFBP9039]